MSFECKREARTLELAFYQWLLLWWGDSCTDPGSFSPTLEGEPHWCPYTTCVLWTYAAELSIRWPRGTLAMLRFYGSKMGYLVDTRLLPGSLVNTEILLAPRPSYSKSLCWFSSHVLGPCQGVYCLTEPFVAKLFAKRFKEKMLVQFHKLDSFAIGLIISTIKREKLSMEHRGQGNCRTSLLKGNLQIL